jgi:D-sedoheptulose 7-phosphate isomerase
MLYNSIPAMVQSSLQVGCSYSSLQPTGIFKTSVNLLDIRCIASMTDQSADDLVVNYFRHSLLTMQQAAGDDQLHRVIRTIADLIEAVFRSGNKLMIAGNGGSAGDAQHIAGEFLSRLNFDRAPLPAVALTTDTSVLTAIGNDYGFEQVFERQVRGLGKRGDALLAISTSGRSPNILAALRIARDLGILTIGFTGAEGNSMNELCEVCLVAPSRETPLIQQIHITAAHIICDLVERSMFKKPA